jgi:N-acetylglucosamine-6-phosphate deacetylase
MGNVPTGSHTYESVTVTTKGAVIDSLIPCEKTDHELPWLLPGFIDQHSHGGGGGAFESAEAAQIERAIEFHRGCGTTSIMASVVSAGVEELKEQVSALIPYVKSRELMGIHLEGPWINPERRGAHDLAGIRSFDKGEFDALLAMAGDSIAMITVAPEVSGVLESIAQICSAGIVVAIGHTEADYELSLQALDAGATVATHLFNAMPELLHRSPGPAGAFFERDDTFIELIADFEHVHPALIQAAIRVVGSERAILVSDSICATGCPSGHYELGTLNVDVDKQKVTIAGSDILAGSLLTLHSALLNVVNAGLITLVQASEIAAAAPANAMGLAEQGRIWPGYRADLVALNADLSINTVIAQGVEREHG